MSLAHVFGPQLGSPSIPNFTPIVFVVDEDVSVRASLEVLILSAGSSKLLCVPDSSRTASHGTGRRGFVK
jgi:hypothetical protein